jgi:RNA polymerase sigma-70 factor, ECF subfamily
MSQVMHDDASDLAGAKAGSAEAFARLYDRHAPVVLSLCRRLASHDAEDALQETFIRAFDRLDQLREPAGWRSWLYAIARRVCAERRRAAGRRHRHEVEAMTQRSTSMNAAHDGRAGPAAPPARAEHAESLDRLSAAMDHLADDERLALHLYYLEQNPARAASESLGISRSGFYKLLDRARDRLAALLGDVASSSSSSSAASVGVVRSQEDGSQ